MTGLAPRAVVVHRRTELTELVDRHGTRGQVEFFLRSRGRSLAEVQARHDAVEEALRAASAAVPADWRTGRVERADLDRFVFDPSDVVVVVGQDGLVANVAKSLDGQPVIGVDPEPARHPGVLVPHRVGALPALLGAAAAGTAAVQHRTMVTATTDDGQSLRALNEVFVGHRSHQSAWYCVRLPDGRSERQGSSGVIVGTGTGATGWCRSAWLERGSALDLPAPVDPGLAWFVREAWPSPATGTLLTEGLLAVGEALEVLVEAEALVVFGDGLESDRLTATWGQTVTVRRSSRTLRLVTAAG